MRRAQFGCHLYPQTLRRRVNHPPPNASELVGGCWLSEEPLQVLAAVYPNHLAGDVTGGI